MEKKKTEKSRNQRAEDDKQTSRPLSEEHMEGKMHVCIFSDRGPGLLGTLGNAYDLNYQLMKDCLYLESLGVETCILSWLRDMVLPGSMSLNSAEPENIVVWIVTDNVTAIEEVKKEDLWKKHISKMEVENEKPRAVKIDPNSTSAL